MESHYTFDLDIGYLNLTAKGGGPGKSDGFELVAPVVEPVQGRLIGEHDMAEVRMLTVEPLHVVPEPFGSSMGVVRQGGADSESMHNSRVLLVGDSAPFYERQLKAAPESGKVLMANARGFWALGRAK